MLFFVSQVRELVSLMIQPQYDGDSQDFAEAFLDWDVERLVKDLEGSENRLLTPAEKRNLRAMLLGLSPSQAQERMGVAKRTRSLDGYFTKIRRIVELFLGLDISTLRNSHDVINALASYRKGQKLQLLKLEFDLLGRDADRAELEKISKQHKIVLLKAAAGIGKSALAQEFLRTYFTKVIEINMALSPDDNAPALERLPIILKEFGEDASNNFGLNLETLKRRLSDKSQPSVAFLIDNIEPALGSDLKFLEKLRDYEGLLQVLGDRDVCSFTLITSRRSMIVQRVKVHEYSLQGLDIKAWREYFHDCENGATSEALEQMRVAYSGNAKAMNILHGAITNRFDGNIEAYWNRCKNALLADAELETLISVEMDWLRDNQPDAYKLLCRMGCYRYQNVKTVPFEGLICLLWEMSESRKACIVDYLSKSFLIELNHEYYLHPAVREITKLRLQEDKLHWESTNLAAANFYQSVAGEIRSLQDGILLLESFYHAISSNNFQKALHLLIPKIEIVNTESQSIRTIPKLRTLGYINESLSCLEILHNHIDEIVDQAIVGYLYGQLGDLYTLSGNFEKGIIGYQNSLLLTGKFENGSVRIDHWVDSKGALALLYFHLGNYVQSQKTFYETLEDASRLALLGKKYLCYIYACLSFLCCQDRSSYHLSQKYIGNSIELLPFLENSPHTWIRSYGLYYLTRSLIVHGRYSESQAILNKLQVLAIQNSFRLVENLILLCEGYLFISQSNNSSAIKTFSYAEKGLQKIGAIYELADTYSQLGLTYQAMGEHDQAETYKAKALELFDQMKAPKQIDRVNQAFEQRS